MKKIDEIQSIIEELNKPVDPRLIQKRVMFRDRTGKEHIADYISGSTAIMLLNKIFGNDGWSFEVKGFTTETYGDNGSVYVFKCHGRLRVMVFTGEDDRYLKDVIKEDVGVAIMEVKKGKPIISSVLEAQMKGAVTDALKRCARQVGQALGNSLYMDDEFAAIISSSESDSEPFLSEETVNLIEGLIRECGLDPVKYKEAVLRRLGISSLEQMSPENAEALISALKKKAESNATRHS